MGVIGKAYCSTANLGAGFDVFGLALDKYADRVQIRITSGKEIKIFVKGPKGHQIPREATKNSAGPPAIALLKEAGLKRGLEITLEKSVPHGLGLGSSGATAAACTKTLNHLLNLELSNDELVRFATLGEEVVAGTAHADNVAASILGGFVVVYGSPIKTICFKPPPNMSIAVATPQLAVRQNKTRMARKVVPERIDVKKAILNIGHASAIVAGFARGDVGMIGEGMEDKIAEPHRERLIPGFGRVKRAAQEAGASGVSISGAGPSIVAMVDRKHQDPAEVGRAMLRGFADTKTRSTWFVARPAPGATIIEAN